jgi:hypothetical protein
MEMADQDALRRRRLELRAMADDILAAMRDMPSPKTWLDAGRTLRALATADRTLTQLYLQPRRTRARPAKPPQARVTDMPLRDSAGSRAPTDAAPRHTVAETASVAAEPQALYGIGERPSKGPRGRLKHSTSPLATAVSGSTACWPPPGKTTLPFVTASPPHFRPGKPEIP